MAAHRSRGGGGWVAVAVSRDATARDPLPRPTPPQDGLLCSALPPASTLPAAPGHRSRPPAAALLARAL